MLQVPITRPNGLELGSCEVAMGHKAFGTNNSDSSVFARPIVLLILVLLWVFRTGEKCIVLDVHLFYGCNNL